MARVLAEQRELARELEADPDSRGLRLGLADLVAEEILIRLEETMVKPWLEMLPVFEGRTKFLYPDGGGVPTCGEGHACESPEEAVQIFGDLRAADDWHKIRSAPRGLALRIYEAMTVCRIDDAKIDQLRDADVAETERKLDRFLPDWRGWPAGVMDALRDIEWNTGHLGFPHMLNAIRGKAWATAAAESHRPEVQQVRNEWTREAILSAAGAA